MGTGLSILVSRVVVVREKEVLITWLSASLSIFRSFD